MLVRDLIIFDTFSTGLNRESMYQSAISVPAGLIASVPPNLMNGILYSTGLKDKDVSKENTDPYVNQVYAWNRGTLIQMAFYVLLFSSVIGFGAYYLMKDYSLTTAVATKMDAINHEREEIAKKNAELADTSTSNEKEMDKESRSLEDGSEKSTSRVESMEVSTLPVNEANLMNHFSQLENKAMSEASVVNGHNEALSRIRNSILLGGGVLGPLALISLLTGTIYQIKNGLPFVTLCLTFFSMMMIYEGYEIFRFIAVSQLYRLSSDELMEMVKRAVERNNKYSMNLKEALEKAEIDENDHGGMMPDDDHPISRLTMTKKASKKSILEEAAPEDEKHPLSGYKRIFASGILMIIIGIIAAVL